MWGRKEFLTDMVRLQQLGVRGSVIMSGDEGEWFKFEITEEGVLEFVGAVTFPDTPGNTYKSEEDIG